ncbi:competence/damage-inducible protein A [Marinimicrococcus flavescens]|uniref:Molybdopterin-binding protein n=1 Tax=Marinimicrococcus flavescens TaxID=3031815 RepID=A0AAP3XQW8_9PROT|nr:molybdopterin-binding protein [Marinimicrococcus flavescens]
MSETNPTAGLVVVGNEILSGRTADANMSYLGQALGALGIRLVEARVVADEEASIVEAVNALRARCTYVFTTGGIGPTHDDITSACVAAAVGRPMERNKEAERRLLAFYPPEKVNEARMKMADMPVGAELIDNPVSVAPGFRVENVYVLPGVPRIMQAMFELLRHRLKGGAPLRSKTVVCYCGEGEIATALGAIQKDHPGVDIGSYPFMRMGTPGTSIVFRSTDEAAIASATSALLEETRSRGFETDEQMLA